MTRHIERPQLTDEYFNALAVLPYGLTVEEIEGAINETYDFFHAVNTFLVGRVYDRLEDTLLGNSFAGLLSEVLVKSVAKNCEELVRNRHVGGYPDLIVRGKYPGDVVLRGQEGIEIKASKQSGGWQGHNAEQGWIMIFRYVVDTTTAPIANRQPTQIVEVMAANLTLADWSFSGRSETSRRTITASINAVGTTKLRNNAIYRDPRYNVTLRSKKVD